MTDNLMPEREGLDKGHIDGLPSREQIASEYAAIGTMRTALVRTARLDTIDAAAESWSRVHELFKDIPETLESDLSEVLSEWEGADAEGLRARVRDLAAYGGELAAGIDQTAHEILPYVRRHLAEAHMRAPFPDQCFPGDVPDRGPGSRALEESEKVAVWEARGGTCPKPSCPIKKVIYCCAFYDWHNEEFYPHERAAMVDALTYAARALTLAMNNWDPAPLPGDFTRMPETDTDFDPMPPGGGSGTGGGGGTGGGSGPTSPLPDPPDIDLGTGGGGDLPGPIDPDDLLPPPPLPDGSDDLESGDRPEIELPNGNRLFHPWALALIPDAEWERMARNMPDELWERLAAESPHAIPPELAAFAPEHLFNAFPCNDSDWEPPLDEDGKPVPFAVFDEELAGHMTPEMEDALRDYDRADGKAAWEERYTDDGPGGQSKDVTTRSWYQDV